MLASGVALLASVSEFVSVRDPNSHATHRQDTIEWTNKDIVAHTATARNGDFDVALSPNKTGSFVLKNAGAVDYYCRFHPNMKASLKIEP